MSESTTKCILCDYPIPKDGDEMCKQYRIGETENPELALPEWNLQELRDRRDKLQ